ncbi:hypothetical protein Sjap_006310 [Stephania japonica]|uniref:COP1-interacting protein 7 n=1 Tax=Stephania japonica TaxID=461633 RepID=A0AAP0PJM1_9MAGN
MKSTTRLDSAVFQLTPTRTRYDLVLTANGKTQKIASGLLGPFLAHLKTAQDQIAKGGYSITLRPDPDNDSLWFTKGTMERFVRFVSTPEVLERVTTIESEILQIEEAISIQNNDNLGMNTVDILHKEVEDHKTKSLESIADTNMEQRKKSSKPTTDIDASKAIVLYKQPEAFPPESNGSDTLEENSKVQLLKVLEARKNALRKEQGMAFARAAAAGFDMDPVANLVSFAECFGASRLLDACLRFMNLWKEKHESGQWLDIEAAELMSSRSVASTMDASGTLPFMETLKQKDLHESWQDLNVDKHNESNGKVIDDANADKSSPSLDQHDYFHAQFQHPMFPHWPPGAPPVFQAYPMQGVPYYPNYPGSGPYFQSAFPPIENPNFNTPPRMGPRRHSKDGKEINSESETWELGGSSMRSQDNSEVEKGNSDHQNQHRTGRSGRNKFGTMVIRNINYITSNKQNKSCSDSESDTETDEELEDGQDNASKKHKNLIRSSKSEGICLDSNNDRNPPDNSARIAEQETEFGNWQAFQNCLLREGGVNEAAGRSMFSMDKDAQVIRRQNATGADPILTRELHEVDDGRITKFGSNGEQVTRIRRASGEELLISAGEFGGSSRESKVDALAVEMEGGRGGGRRVTNDDFMIYRADKSTVANLQSETISGDALLHTRDNMHGSSLLNATDESFIIPLRSSSKEQIGTGERSAIDMSIELPSGLRKTVDQSTRNKSQLSYEPEDWSLIHDRGGERESVGYDPAVDYEMLEHAEKSYPQNKNAMSDDNKLSRLNKGKKSKVTQDNSLEKSKVGEVTKKVKPSKLGPSNEAQARAERLRAYKADLQKMKKQMEEEELKRLETLKRERQKRIASRGASSSTQSTVPPRSKPQLSTKLSPGSHKGSRFSDSEPGMSSPLQRLPIRTTSVGSSDSQKIIRTSRLSSGGHFTVSGLSRSVSSLPELKKEKYSMTPEPKIRSARIRRLSEPKVSTNARTSTIKALKVEPDLKTKASDGAEMAKISAIMKLDKTKASTLPELKIRTGKGSPGMVNNKSGTKELSHKTNGSRSSITSENAKSSNDDKNLGDSNGDNYQPIDKTIVMLEPPQIYLIQGSKESGEIRNFPSDIHDDGEKSQIVSEDLACLLTSEKSHKMPNIVEDSATCQLDGTTDSNEVTKYGVAAELSKSSSANIAETRPYEAPYAQTTSLEDPCTTNSEYSKALPSNSLVALDADSTKAYVSDLTGMSSLEPIPESIEKPRGKESSKGFKRLLKFGRKTASSSESEHDLDSDKLSINGSQDYEHATSSASCEVHTLKNLISQDETPTAGTTQKVSRPFSLLSPFRSKTNEKKMTA